MSLNICFLVILVVLIVKIMLMPTSFQQINREIDVALTLLLFKGSRSAVNSTAMGFFVALISLFVKGEWCLGAVSYRSYYQVNEEKIGCISQLVISVYLRFFIIQKGMIVTTIMLEINSDS